jgi:hypothetical protein
MQPFEVRLLLRSSPSSVKTFGTQYYGRIRLSLSQVVEYTHIVDFASIVGIYRCACNTAEAGKELFRKRVKRVAGRVSHDQAQCGRLRAEDAFQSSEIGASTFF